MCLIWNDSPDSSSPLVPINGHIKLSQVEQTHNSIKSSRVQHVLIFKHKITNPSFMGTAIFTNTLVLLI